MRRYHELGHSFGLDHQDSFGNDSVPNAESTGADAGRILSTSNQNNQVLSTGTTGATEAQRETLRSFGELEHAKLEFVPELNTSPRATIAESGSAHGTLGTAQRLGLDVTPTLAKAGVRAAIVDAAQIASPGEEDWYSFVARAGDILTVQTMSQDFTLGEDEVDTELTVFNSAGTAIYGPLNGTRYSTTQFLNASGGTSIGMDEMFANLPLTSGGSYYIRVRSAGTDTTGAYILATTLRGDRFAELDDGTLTIYGSTSGDTISASFSGNDLNAVVNGTTIPVLKASVTDIVVQADSGNDTVSAGSGMNKPMTILGGAGADTLTGGDGDDVIEGGADNDTLAGGLGNDGFRYSGASSLGTDTITEGTGGSNDYLDYVDFTTFNSGSGITLNLSLTTAQTMATGTSIQFNNAASVEGAVGTAYADTLTGNTRENAIDGLGGADTIYGGDGDDDLGGGDGDDVIYGQNGADYILGGNGSDRLEGGSANDELYGNDGDDAYVYTGTSLGTDSVFEEIGEANDAMDFFDFQGYGAAIQLDLGITTSQTIATGTLIYLNNSSAFEGAFGSAYNDVIKGNSRNNAFEGMAGNDTIYGYGGNDDISGDDAMSTLTGNDVIYGGDGADTIYGGKGDDDLYGEAGNDTIYAGDGIDDVSGGNDVDWADGGPGTDVKLDVIETAINFP